MFEFELGKFFFVFNEFKGSIVFATLDDVICFNY